LVRGVLVAAPLFALLVGVGVGVFCVRGELVGVEAAERREPLLPLKSSNSGSLLRGVRGVVPRSPEPSRGV
jgi:hypothetical protein